MNMRVPRACLMVALVCETAIAAYLPILGARSVRFQVAAPSVATPIASLPPLSLHDNDPPVDGSILSSNRPPPQVSQVDGLGPVPSAAGYSGEEDPMAAGLPENPSNGELLGPREPSEPPQIAPQVFLKFFTPRGTNRAGIITLPATFTPPVVPPPNNQSSATLEIR